MNDRLVFVTDGTVPVTTSRIVANYFGKRHDHVIRGINQIVSDMQDAEETASVSNAPNFGAVKNYFIKHYYVDAKGENRTQYLLTQDGFTLTVMGFTGKKALKVQLAFINQFNQTKAELEHLRTTTDEQSYFEKQRINYLEYKPSYHNSMHAIKLLIDYAVKYFNADKLELDGYFYRRLHPTR